MFRLLHFITLFAYLNVLCLEVQYYATQNTETTVVGETFIEVVLENVLDIEHSDEANVLPEIMHDDYRILVLFLGLFPLFFYFSWLIGRIYLSNERVKHFIYFIKRLILPQYFIFLHRYKPF